MGWRETGKVGPHAQNSLKGFGGSEQEWSGQKIKHSIRDRQKSATAGWVAWRLSLLEGADHLGVGERCVATDRNTLWQRRIPAGPSKLLGQVQRHRRELAGMDRLAQAGVIWQGNQGQATQQREQAAEVAVTIGPRLAIDEGGQEDAAGHIEAATDGEQPMFLTSQPVHQLAVKTIDGEPLGDDRGGGTSYYSKKALQAVWVVRSKMFQIWSQLPNRSKTNPYFWTLRTTRGNKRN